MSDLNYQDACRDAATRQGLNPVVEELRRHGIEVSVEQTGGFVMVAYVYNRDDPWRRVGITSGETWNGGDGFLVVGYDGEEDEEGEILAENTSVEAVDDLACSWLRWPTQADVKAAEDSIRKLGDQHDQ